MNEKESYQEKLEKYNELNQELERYKKIYGEEAVNAILDEEQEESKVEKQDYTIHHFNEQLTMEERHFMAVLWVLIMTINMIVLTCINFWPCTLLLLMIGVLGVVLIYDKNFVDKSNN